MRALLLLWAAVSAASGQTPTVSPSALPTPMPSPMPSPIPTALSTDPLEAYGLRRP